jgi:hypothetical protein
MLVIPLWIIVSLTVVWGEYKKYCQDEENLKNWDLKKDECLGNRKAAWRRSSGTWGGFGSIALLMPLEPNKKGSEMAAFAISNGAQLVYSLLYLLLVYNITLISMERE